MKLHDIVLLETSSNRTRMLEMDEVIQLAKTTYSNYFKQFDYPVLYRGSATYSQNMHPILVDPSVGTRGGSEKTGFGYTEIISNIDSWRGLPKRNRALICTADRKTAIMYGAISSVVLPNKFKAIVSDTDFWYAYRKKMDNTYVRSLYSFDVAIRGLFDTPKSWEDFINNKIPRYIEKYSNLTQAQVSINLTGALRELHSAISKYSGGDDKITRESVIMFLNDFFDPTTVSTIDIRTSLPDIKFKELWTNDTCMILGDDIYYHIKKTIEAI